MKTDSIMNRESPSPHPHAKRTTLSVAAVLASALPIQVPGFHSISFGLMLAIFLSPTILASMASMTYGHALGKGAALVAFTTPFLIWANISLDPSRAFSRTAAVTSVGLLLGLLFQVGSVAWASSILGVVRVSLLYGAGATLNAAINPELWSANPWKYAFAWPVSVLVIATLARYPRSLQPVAVALMALYALTHESRNSAGVLLLTLLAALAAYVFHTRRRKSRGLLILILSACGSLAIVSIVTQIALSGKLGAEIQHTQIAQSYSSTPIPGRVEYAATFALMKQHPVGLGPGVIPSGADIDAGKSGLAAIGAATSGDYVDGRMFANAFEVHSVAGDLWVQFGMAGLLIAVVIAVSLIRVIILIQDSPLNGTTALCAFLAFQAVWDLLFSPLYANFRPVGFAVGVAIFLLSSTVKSNSTEVRRLNPSHDATVFLA